LTSEFSLEIGGLIFGILIGIFVRLIMRRYNLDRKTFFLKVKLLGIGVVGSFLLAVILSIISTFVFFWIGFLLGYFVVTARKDYIRSQLELISAFARAGTSREKG